MADRETDQEQRDRKDAERDEVRRARQVRLGHVAEPKKKAASKKKEAVAEEE